MLQMRTYFQIPTRSFQCQVSKLWTFGFLHVYGQCGYACFQAANRNTKIQTTTLVYYADVVVCLLNSILTWWWVVMVGFLVSLIMLIRLTKERGVDNSFLPAKQQHEMTNTRSSGMHFGEFFILFLKLNAVATNLIAGWGWFALNVQAEQAWIISEWIK